MVMDNYVDCQNYNKDDKDEQCLLGKFTKDGWCTEDCTGYVMGERINKVIHNFIIDDLSIDSINMETEVKHPAHYTSHPSGVECKDIVIHHNMAIGSAIKYLWRCGLKNGESKVKEISKAIQWLEFELERLKGGK